MKKVISIHEFPGLMQRADTRDVPLASRVENIDTVKRLGVLQPSLGYSDLGVNFNSTTIRQLIEYLNPQHDENTRILFVRNSAQTISFSLDVGSGFRTPVDRGMTKFLVFVSDAGDVTFEFENAFFDDISFVERNGVIYGGVGTRDDRYSFIFLLTDYKRFEDFDNAGTYGDDWTLESATTIEDSYLLEQYDLLPPLNEHVRLTNITSESNSDFSNKNYENFANAAIYGFFFTFIYDGFQESGFKDVKESVGISRAGITIPSEYIDTAREHRFPISMRSSDASYQVTLGSSENAIIFNFEVAVNTIPRRVTGINIWANLLSGGNNELLNKTEIKLVQTIPIDDKQTYLGRKTEVSQYNIKGFTSRWDDQGGGWWRFMEEPRESADIYVSKQQIDFGKPWAASLGYLATTKISPKYKFNHILNDVMYAGPVSYESVSGEWEYFANIFVWSAFGGQFSVLPFTNRGIITGEITGISSLLNTLLVFTLADLFIFEDGAQIDVKPGIGCFSHFSIVGHSNYKYWASKKGFIKYNGYKEEKISDYFIETTYSSLTESQKKSISGVYAPDQDQIIWTVPDIVTFIYSLRDDSWSMRDYGLSALTQSIALDVYGTDRTDVFKLNDTNERDGSDYTTTYTLKNLDGGLSSVVKTLTVGYIGYKSLSDITLTILHLDKVMKIITLASTSGERKIKQFDIGINAESVDIKIVANGASEYQIEYIDFWGDINDLKGN